jgi:GNAT superfamily N-acetyltransferase
MRRKYFYKGRERIGTARFDIYDDNKGRTAFIHTFSLKRDYRGQGLGRKCYQCLEKLFRDENAIAINIGALSDSVRFWKKMGYQIAAGEPPAPEVFCMTKNLKQQPLENWTS